MDKETQINQLRLFFKSSIFAFSFGRGLLQVFGSTTIPLISTMEALHNCAYQELIKENPDMEIIADLPKEMEDLARKNKMLNDLCKN
jgi:hypothetical protein